MKKLLLLMMLIATVAMAAKIPSGIVVTDGQGNTYDLDALMAEGKSIIVHKTAAF